MTWHKSFGIMLLLISCCLGVIDTGSCREKACEHCEGDLCEIDGKCGLCSNNSSYNCETRTCDFQEGMSACKQNGHTDPRITCPKGSCFDKTSGICFIGHIRPNDDPIEKPTPSPKSQETSPRQNTSEPTSDTGGTISKRNDYIYETTTRGANHATTALTEIPNKTNISADTILISVLVTCSILIVIIIIIIYKRNLHVMQGVQDLIQRITRMSNRSDDAPNDSDQQSNDQDRQNEDSQNVAELTEFLEEV